MAQNASFDFFIFYSMFSMLPVGRMLQLWPIFGKQALSPISLDSAPLLTWTTHPNGIFYNEVNEVEN